MTNQKPIEVHTGTAIGWYRCDGKNCPVCESIPSEKWMKVLQAEGAKVKPIEEALREALKEAIGAIKVFHGPGWEIYRDHSPEMKRWNALLAAQAPADTEVQRWKDTADRYMLEALTARKQFVELRKYMDEKYIHRDNAAQAPAELTVAQAESALRAAESAMYAADHEQDIEGGRVAYRLAKAALDAAREKEPR